MRQRSLAILLIFASTLALTSCISGHNSSYPPNVNPAELTDVDFSYLDGRTADEVTKVDFEYGGYGTIYDFPGYALDLRSRKFSKYVGQSDHLDLEVLFKTTATPEEVSLVRQNLGGDKLPKRLTDLGYAGEYSRIHEDCLDGGAATLTVAFKDVAEYKTRVHDCGIELTGEQERTLRPLVQLSNKRG